MYQQGHIETFIRSGEQLPALGNKRSLSLELR